jgi:hypothetical protein
MKEDSWLKWVYVIRDQETDGRNQEWPLALTLDDNRSSADSAAHYTASRNDYQTAPATWAWFKVLRCAAR